MPNVLPTGAADAAYLQTVVQSKVLVAFPRGEKQVTRSLGVCSFVPRHLRVFHRRRLQILTDANKLPPGLRQLRKEPHRHQQALDYSVSKIQNTCR